MKNSFKIPFTQNQAKKIVSKDDLRPAMRGVYFNGEKREFCLTDGHKLIMVVPVDTEDLPEDSFIIPLGCLPKTKKDTSLLKYSFCSDTNTINCYNWENDSKATFRAIEERYPDYDNVIPKDTDVEISKIGLDPQLLEDTNVFLKGFEIDSRGLELNFCGKNRAIKFRTLQEVPSYYVHGLIMSMMI